VTTLATTAARYAGSAAPEGVPRVGGHGRRCRACLSAGRAASSRCKTGRDAWAVYVAARDGAEHPERLPNADVRPLP